MNKVKTVAVIGGGMAGLSAGCFLAQQGLNVKLFEANDKLGGACATTTINGFTFNDGALYLALPGILNHVFDRLQIERAGHLPLRKITAVMKSHAGNCSYKSSLSHKKRPDRSIKICQVLKK